MNWKKINIVERMNAIEDLLWEFYLPCKAVVYFNEITPQRCVTILRQILRLHNHKLLSNQKYLKHVKITMYQICQKEIYGKFSVEHRDVLLKF